MRHLKRNQKAFTYKIYKGRTDAVDSSGFLTGKQVIEYYDAVSTKGLVVPTGKSDWKPYGVDKDYSIELVPDKPILNINEESLVYIDNEKYVVVAIITTINEQTLYLK